MNRYTVKLAPPGAHLIPPLLERFGKWLAKQPYGSLGYFELIAEAVPEQWCQERASTLSTDAFSFLRLPDGSLLVLIQPLRRYPAAVAYLGSEGEASTVASSLEEFLLLLARGETEVDELDDEHGAKGRKKLAAWLDEEGVVRASEAPKFDFAAYLDGAAYDVSTMPSLPPPAPSAELALELPPFLRELVLVTGLRADDPALVDFVTQRLGKKPPGSVTESTSTKHVTVPKLGVELLFNYDLGNDKYPLVHKTKKAFVPYLSGTFLSKKLPEPLPLGLEIGMSAALLSERLGEPSFATDETTRWDVPLVAARDVVLSVWAGAQCMIRVLEARALSRHGVPNRAIARSSET